MKHTHTLALAGLLGLASLTACSPGRYVVEIIVHDDSGVPAPTKPLPVICGPQHNQQCQTLDEANRAAQEMQDGFLGQMGRITSRSLESYTYAQQGPMDPNTGIYTYVETHNHLDQTCPAGCSDVSPPDSPGWTTVTTLVGTRTVQSGTWLLGTYGAPQA